MQNRCQLFLTLMLWISMASKHIVVLALLLGQVLGPGERSLSALSAIFLTELYDLFCQPLSCLFCSEPFRNCSSASKSRLLSRPSFECSVQDPFSNFFPTSALLIFLGRRQSDSQTRSLRILGLSVAFFWRHLPPDNLLFLATLSASSKPLLF